MVKRVNVGREEKRHCTLQAVGFSLFSEEPQPTREILELGAGLQNLEIKWVIERIDASSGAGKAVQITL